MRSPLIQSLLTIVCILAFSAGCTVQLQSPIKISRNKEEKKETPSETTVYAPLPQSPGSPETNRQPGVTAATSKPEEEALAGSPEALRSPDDILILSETYWNGFDDSLGRVTIKDVSGQGLSESNAKNALKIEAYNQFGSRAGGIININYEHKENWRGAEAIAVASGDVVAWSDLVSTPSPKASTAPVAQPARTATPAALSYAQSAVTEEPLQPSPAIVQKTPSRPSSNEAPGGVPSPAAVLILTDQDLVQYKFSVVGKISVFSKSGGAFDMEDANRALKAEAFRRYGPQARGVINITYKEKSGLFNWGGDAFSEASGDVVTWEGQRDATYAAMPAPAPIQEPASSSPGMPSAPESHSVQSSQPAPLYHEPTPSSSPQSAAYSTSSFNPSSVLVVSPEGLVSKEFQLLGKITVKDSSGKSFDEESAAEALKVEAYKQFGPQARAITNLDYERKPGLINLKKYGRASADVITWGVVEDHTPPKPVPVAAASPYYSRQDEESVPEYTTGANSYEDIHIITTDDLLITDYETLGSVTFQSRDRSGIRTYEADIELQRQAFNTYGEKARAIINVEYKKAVGPNTSSDKVVQAKGDVITW